MTSKEPKNWIEFEEARIALGLSRAELQRRAGMSETTMFKGLKAYGVWKARTDAGDHRALNRGAPGPIASLRGKLLRVIENERAMQKVRDEAARHLQEAGL